MEVIYERMMSIIRTIIRESVSNAILIIHICLLLMITKEMIIATDDYSDFYSLTFTLAKTC
jgi:hypothetical protein